MARSRPTGSGTTGPAGDIDRVEGQLAPARWERAGAIAGFAAATLLIASLATLSSSPSIGSPGVVIVDHLETNYAATIAASYGATVAALLMLPFLASLRTFVRRRDDESEWRWTVTLLAAAVAVAMLMLASALLGASAVVADRTADTSAVVSLFAAAKISYTLALIPLATIVLANAHTMATARAPARWLVRFAVEIGVVALLASATLVVDSDWAGAGESVVAAAGLFLALWVIAVAATIYDGGMRTRPE
jgi:hypothetical protein